LIEILPYNELNNVDLNFEKLFDLAANNYEHEVNEYFENKNLDTEKKIVCIDARDLKLNQFNGETVLPKDNKNMTNFYEKVFTENERKYLRRMFLTYSSDAIMSNKQFWSFLDLDFIYNTTFAKTLYKSACDFNDNSKSDHLKFMDYTKFIQFVGIFTKDVIIEISDKEKIQLNNLRLKFIFRVFDSDDGGEIDKLEFRNVLTSFVELILICKFDNEIIQEKIRNLSIDTQNIFIVEKALDLYVEEIFNSFSYNGEILTYDEWEKWIKSLKGLDNLLNFSGILSYGDGK